MKNRRLVPFTQLRQYDIPFTRVWVNELIRRGQFPSPVRLSTNRIVWYEDEILEFTATRPRVWRGADAAD